MLTTQMQPTLGTVDADLSQPAAERALQALLDAHARHERSAQELSSGLIDICTRQPAATWAALSLLDQFHRREVISTTLFRELKKELNAIAFGSAGNRAILAPGPEQDRTSTAVATLAHLGTRVDDTAFDADTAFQTEYEAPSTIDATLPRTLRVQQTQLVKTSLEKSPALRPGTLLLNRYVLIEPLTSGGIGVVFKALDHQRAALPEAERYVAIKSLHERLQNQPRAIAALQHEYLQSQAVSHPNIVKVYDFHQAEGLCFIAMELVEGESLSRLCERIAPRRLPQSSALTIVREIGHALAHAHDRGVVHGNLYPNNVVVTSGGNVRVSEFGQATAWLETVALAPHSVIEHRDDKPSAPELHYRSPQQKSAAPAAAADDLYSLASIAHELLCGRTPDFQALHGKQYKPQYARHLSTGQWRALQRGLAEDRSQRGDEVRQWLTDLNLSTADVRLPSLLELEAGITNEKQHLSSRTLMIIGALGVAILLMLLGTLYLWPAKKPPLPAPITQVTANDILSPPIETAPSSAAATATTSDVATSAANNTQPQILSNAKFPTVSFDQERYNVRAGERAATLTIRRSGPSNKKITLQWFTVEDTAKSGVDYARDSNTTVQLLPGQPSAQISIPLISGPQRNHPLWFDVRIRATADAAPGEWVVATVYLAPSIATGR